MPQVLKVVPDALEDQLARTLEEAAEIARKEEWSNREWTRQVKNRIGRLADPGSVKVYASQCDYGHNGEWLVDMTWIHEPGGFVVDVPLALESEWGDADAVSYDFQKLLVLRARHRVMLFGASSNQDAQPRRESLLEEIRRCSVVQPGDRFLFGIFLEEPWGFEVSSFVAGE